VKNLEVTLTILVPDVAVDEDNEPTDLDQFAKATRDAFNGLSADELWEAVDTVDDYDASEEVSEDEESDEEESEGEEESEEDSDE